MDEQLEQRIKSFEAEMVPLLKKYHLKMDIAMEFPDYLKLPPEVQLARIVLTKHNMEYRIVYRDNPEK